MAGAVRDAVFPAHDAPARAHGAHARAHVHVEAVEVRAQ